MYHDWNLPITDTDIYVCSCIRTYIISKHVDLKCCHTKANLCLCVFGKVRKFWLDFVALVQSRNMVLHMG